MHSDELRKLNEGIEDPAIHKIIDELITRSDLHTAAIVAMNESDLDIADAEVKALFAHTASEKRPYTVDEIEAVRVGNGWSVKCRDVFISTGLEGWTAITADIATFRTENVALMLASGLRETGNVPEEYK